MEKKYIGLKYNTKKNKAPYVLFKFRTSYIDKITKILKKYEIPVFRDELLVSILDQVPAGKEIPEELYFAIAKIYAILIENGYI